MAMTLTKCAAKSALGFEKDTQFADFLATSKQNVNRWGEDEPLPESRQWQLMALRPDLFSPPPANDVASSAGAAA